MMNRFYPMLIAIILSAAASHWATDLHWSNKWSERDAKDAEAVAQIQSAALTKQQELLHQIERVQIDAKKAFNKISADNDQLATNVTRLRQQLNLSEVKHKDANTTIAELRRAAATNTVVRDELLNWTIGAAQELAVFAARSREAGLACQSAYNAIKDIESSRR